jgi:hypothetical protein
MLFRVPSPPPLAIVPGIRKAGSSNRAVAADLNKVQTAQGKAQWEADLGWRLGNRSSIKSSHKSFLTKTIHYISCAVLTRVRFLSDMWVAV